MSDHFDIDDDGIDWDEAALIVEAASVPSPALALAAAESSIVTSHQDHEAAVATAAFTTKADPPPLQLAETYARQRDDEEELLILYDLLARADADDPSAELVDDIEDLMVSSAAVTGAGAAASRRASRTLYDQFRKRRGFLSVTDLTAPGGWCEVQYSYSLLGRRDLKPEARVRSRIASMDVGRKVLTSLSTDPCTVLSQRRSSLPLARRSRCGGCGSAAPVAC